MVLVLGRGDNLLDRRPITEADRGAGRVDRELPGDIAGNLRFVLQEDLIEGADITEGAAVVQLAAWIHGLGIVEGKRPAVLSETMFRRVTDGIGPVAIPPSAHHIEALECEARWVDVPMARRAAFVGAVLVELLADRDGAANVGFDGRHRGWRRRNVMAHNALENPFAAQDRRSRGAVGGDLEHAGLGHEAATQAVLGEGHPAHLDPVDAGNLVVRREPLVQEGEVGIDDIARGQIVVEQFRKEVARLLDRGFVERLVEIVVVVERRRRSGVLDLPELQPVVEERMDEALRLWVGEHPIRLRLERGGLAQLSLGSQSTERLVGLRIPEKQGQAGGQRIVVELAGFLVDKHEAGRGEHRGVSDEHGARETDFGLQAILDDSEEDLDVLFARRATIGALNEGAEEAFGVLLGIGGFDFHLHRAGTHAAATIVATGPTGATTFPHYIQGDGAVVGALQGQVAEEQFVARRGRVVIERSLNLHPAERDGGNAILLGERIGVTALKTGRPGAEETRRIGDDAFGRQEVNLAQVLDSDFRMEVDATQSAILGCPVGVDRDVFRTTAP